MRREQIEHRILGSVHFVDATTRLLILDPLVVSAQGVSWIRNRRGDYVITAVPGLEDHAATFRDPPATPALDSIAVEFAVRDPRRRYLPRRSTIRLPRNPDPTQAAATTSLFRSIDIPLFPSPTARIELGWAVVRATIRRNGTEDGLAGALIRILHTTDAALLASGLSDERGEALVAVPGIPITTWGESNGAVVETEIPVSLEVVFDPTVSDIPDPDDLTTKRAALPIAQIVTETLTPQPALASGRLLTMTLLATVTNALRVHVTIFQ